MKAISLLRDQHRRIGALLARVADEQQERLALVLQLVEELMTHLSLEDHVFLCGLADATGMRAETYRDNQAEVRNAVLQAVFAEEDDVVFGLRLMELASAFERHVRLMDRDVFPLAEAQLRREHLETMGTRMQMHWNAAIHGDGPLVRRQEHLAAE
jgi:Hemerythrin HHE cation binding domain